MSISEKDALLREREAFVRGSDWRQRIWQRALNMNWTQGEDEIAEAQKRYPLPKVTRPREVFDGQVTWRVANGHIEGHGWPVMGNVSWGVQQCVVPTAERVKLWADLLANPTEELDA